MKIQKYIMKGAVVATAALSLTFSSCINDLNVDPIDPNLDSKDKIYTDLNSYEQGLAKIYAGLAVSGQKGPAGAPDLGGLDEGASQYLRKYWEFQELPTDEAINGWGDPGQPELSQATWAASNVLVEILYYRMTYQITLANQFIRDTEGADFGEDDPTDRMNQMRAEARYLRAMSYWHALDFYGNGIPFTDENSAIGSTPPAPPASGFGGTEIFEFIESELMEITSEDAVQQLKAAKAGFVGQADKAAAYMLLAKLYMNAEVYTGTPRWEDAKVYLEKVINAGYSLEGDYANNFMADNYLSQEIIFSVNYDGLYTQSYGGTTFLIHGAVGGDMSAEEYGIDSGWGGHRSTTALVEKFEDGNEVQVDPRGMFYREHDRANTDLTKFTDGYAVVKYTNKSRLGYNGSDPNLTFVDTNFPVFRLADAYLMLAEAEMRMGGVSGTSMANLEEIWTRGNVSSDLQTAYKAELSSNPEGFLLDERARELYWEGHRRTDLVRFGQFSTSEYVWPWKGGDVNGKGLESKFDLLPLPSSEINANPKLKQNPAWM
ncbi:RagB/SusD family nutrient uptake outer membrane protein [Sediminitomix flava]|uniref:Putative outer membrane starch-binding protein n=1 Tax=Sediminitomix flava TaxID=379075 RepID=A0A315ZBN3_SEDFL|nr:RagB/SusD family nutrient uptake outer membrane protein [Sediminitomix flava]PWJ42483.1 putative outer membrane starch-binding protein [Sediminitomix flava]